ncbi:MAG: U32 family peptidase [Eubacteriales bacterium]|nr:U32 family peptidase [Eubacteriales bacterium]MDD4584148.1 U32 family peptidase [Eubacteriales bacterium]
MKKVELLAPAGDLEKLKIALDYGADGVYCGGQCFGLRAGARNFSIDQLAEGVEYAHSRGKKVYLTLNVFAHNKDINQLNTYLKEMAKIPLDAFIVSDPGFLTEIREHFPKAEIHLSTQANTTNYKSAIFWHKQGVKRIVLARELSLNEIKELREKTPSTLELEVFIHGSMCISYSGRCLISNFMAERDANRGECAHPCRWKYNLVEEKRPGEYYPVIQEETGSYILNSKDLCMIEHLPELINAGLNSLKIEGRTKSIFYVATVVGAYRKAIDSYFSDPEAYQFSGSLFNELEKASHRLFTTGFYFEKPDKKGQNYETSQYVRNWTFLGLVKEYDPKTGFAWIEQRNKIQKGDLVEVFGPGMDYFAQKIDILLNEQGQPIESAPHAQQMVQIKMAEPVLKNYMVRKPK